MATPKRNTRGLQDIRTLSGRVDQASIPYKTYMKLSCLEMEIIRRGEEKESALYRAENIDARLQEIEAEKAAFLQTLDEHYSGKPVTAQDSTPSSVSRRSTGGIKLKY